MLNGLQVQSKRPSQGDSLFWNENKKNQVWLQSCEGFNGCYSGKVCVVFFFFPHSFSTSSFAFCFCQFLVVLFMFMFTCFAESLWCVLLCFDVLMSWRNKPVMKKWKYRNLFCIRIILWTIWRSKQISYCQLIQL